ncbi:hypothetical protein M422DRAFT_775232 [Sphaerobolus stellatus SS14]|nr:hypothetical protein M422DRAFT_775232 [Sphaerobolus stellatus SS14]
MFASIRRLIVRFGYLSADPAVLSSLEQPRASISLEEEAAPPKGSALPVDPAEHDALDQEWTFASQHHSIASRQQSLTSVENPSESLSELVSAVTPLEWERSTSVTIQIGPSQGQRRFEESVANPAQFMSVPFRSLNPESFSQPTQVPSNVLPTYYPSCVIPTYPQNLWQQHNSGIPPCIDDMDIDGADYEDDSMDWEFRFDEMDIDRPGELQELQSSVRVNYYELDRNNMVASMLIQGNSMLIQVDYMLNLVREYINMYYNGDANRALACDSKVQECYAEYMYHLELRQRLQQALQELHSSM